MKYWLIVVAAALLLASCGTSTSEGIGAAGGASVGAAYTDLVAACQTLNGERAPGCDAVGRLKKPPIHFEQPPAVEVTSPYEPGTEDYACDTFIKAVNAWLPEASTGAEYGPSLAAAVETLRDELEALGVNAATDDLQQVADLWGSKPWVQADEEGIKPLMAAAGALTGVGTGRCSELLYAIDPPSTEPAEPFKQPEPMAVAVVAVEAFEPGLACGGIQVPGGMPIPEPRSLDADAQDALDALEAVGGEGATFTNRYEYRIFSRTADRLSLIGTADNGSHADAEFERVDGAWKPVGWGTCEWQAADYRQVAWQVHPDTVVDAADDTIELLADDNCGSVTHDGYEVVVVADYTDDAIRLSVWESLTPPNGGFSDLSCSLGEVIDLHVELPQPIGSRTIQGGSAAPARP